MKDENRTGFKNDLEGWEEKTGEEMPDVSRTGKTESTRLMTIIQIIACMVLLAGAVGVKMNGGALYQTVRSWYFCSLNDSIIADEQLDDAKHRVIDLWSSISRAGPESGASDPGSHAESKQTDPASSQGENTMPAASSEAGASLPQSSPEEGNNGTSGRKSLP